MATSLTSLAGQIFAEQAIIEAVAQIEPIKDIAHRYTEAENTRGASITVPVFAVKTAKDFDGDYTKDAGSAKGVPISIDQHIYDNKMFTDEDFAQCPVNFWEGAGRACGEAIGKGIAQRVLKVINKTNVTAESVLTTSSFTKQLLAKLTAQAAANNFAAAQATLLCSEDLFTTILGFMDANIYGGPEAVQKGSLAPGAYGFGRIVRCNNLTTDEGENLVGAIVHRDAIGYAGAPLKPASPSSLEEHGLATDPASGLTIGFRRFGVNTSGENFMVAEALLGVKCIQPTKIVRLVSAATTTTA